MDQRERHRLEDALECVASYKAEVAALLAALEWLEQANDAVAAATTRERYLTDLADVQPALLELDDARSFARAAIAAVIPQASA